MNVCHLSVWQFMKGRDLCTERSSQRTLEVGTCKTLECIAGNSPVVLDFLLLRIFGGGGERMRYILANYHFVGVKSPSQELDYS